jgi:hypothetical protein
MVNKDKTIPLRDFYYLLAILLIILIAMITIVYGDKDQAGKSLGYASTAISIVLAIVAIIMQIVDIGGQRKGITELNITIDKIEKSQESLKELIESTTSQLDDVSNLKDELIKTMSTTDDSIKTLKEELLQLMENAKKDENNKVNAEEIEKVLTSFRFKNINNATVNSDSGDSGPRKVTLKRLHDYLKRQYKPKELFQFGPAYKEFLEYCIDNSLMPISKSLFKKYLQDLIGLGLVSDEDTGGAMYYSMD